MFAYLVTFWHVYRADNFQQSFVITGGLFPSEKKIEKKLLFSEILSLNKCRLILLILDFTSNYHHKQTIIC